MKAGRIIGGLTGAIAAADEGAPAGAGASRALAYFARSNLPPAVTPADARALAAFARRSFAPLVRLTQVDDAAVRHAAVHALGFSNRPAAVAPLFALLLAPRDWFDHDYVHVALAALGDAALLELEKRALAKDDEVAALALGALAQARGDVLTHLERIRKKRRGALPDGFFHAYRNVRTPSALPILFEQLASRAHAAEALEAAEEILCTVGPGRASARQRQEWSARLLGMLGARDVNVRAQALVCIGRLGHSTKSLPAIVRALSDPDDDVVAAAASALAHLGSSEAMRALEGALDAARPTVRTLAAATLVSSGRARGASKKRAIATLVEGALALPDVWARERALLTLHETRGGAAALCRTLGGLRGARLARGAEALVDLVHLAPRPDAAHQRERARLDDAARAAFDVAWKRRAREESEIVRALERVRSSEPPRSKPPRASSADARAPSAKKRAPRKKAPASSAKRRAPTKGGAPSPKKSRAPAKRRVTRAK